MSRCASANCRTATGAFTEGEKRPIACHVKLMPRGDSRELEFGILAARRTEASGGTIGGDFGLRGLAGALALSRTAV